MKEALAEDKHATPHTVFSCQILSHSVWLLQPLGQQGQQLHAPWLFHWLQGVTFITAITWNLRRRSERKYYIHMQTVEKKGREHDTRCVQYVCNYLSFKGRTCAQSRAMRQLTLLEIFVRSPWFTPAGNEEEGKLKRWSDHRGEQKTPFRPHNTRRLFLVLRR